MSNFIKHGTLEQRVKDLEDKLQVQMRINQRIMNQLEKQTETNQSFVDVITALKNAMTS